MITQVTLHNCIYCIRELVFHLIIPAHKSYVWLMSAMHLSTALRAKLSKSLFFSAFFCRAWPLKVFISFHRFPDTFRRKSCIQVMRRLDLVKLILEEGACSLTSWAIWIIGYCLNFNVAVVCIYKIWPLAQGLVGVTELLAQDPKLLARQLSDMSTLYFKKGFFLGI